MKTVFTLIFFSPLLWATELDEMDFSRFVLLEYGTGAIEGKQNGKTESNVSSDLHSEFGFERLTESEKKEAKNLALDLWIHSPGLLAEETLVPDFSFSLDEDIEGLGDVESKIWQVRVEHLTKGISALIWINAETKEIRAWGIKRELKEEQNKSAHTTPAIAPR